MRGRGLAPVLGHEMRRHLGATVSSPTGPPHVIEVSAHVRVVWGHVAVMGARRKVVIRHGTAGGAGVGTLVHERGARSGQGSAASSGEGAGMRAVDGQVARHQAVVSSHRGWRFLRDVPSQHTRRRCRCGIVL